jgi:hypothetical protein
MSNKEMPVCSHCGSADVLADAYVVWDVETQKWECANVCDKGAYCNACDGETRLDWEEVG